VTDPGEDRKQQNRGISADMAPEAIMRRLQKVAELYDLWRWLRTAERIGPVEQVREQGSEDWQSGDEAGTPEHRPF
jgi:hypothetical protein